MLLALAKAVANASAALVVKARKCAETVDDPHQREEVISAAAQTALAASELVACAKVVAPTVSDVKQKIVTFIKILLSRSCFTD